MGVLTLVADLFVLQIAAIIAVAIGGMVLPPRDWLGLGRARARVEALRASRAGDDAARRLEPLRCPKCDSLVPLVDAAGAPCHHCPTTVRVPPAYRALAHLRADAARDHAAAVKLLRIDAALGRRHWLARLALAALCAGNIAALVIGLADWRIDEWLIPFVPTVIVVSAGLGAIFLFRVDEAPARSIRPELVIPPDRTGDEVPCTTCAAPLVVPPPAFVIASCLYCGAEHLLASRTARRRAVAAGRAEAAATSLLDATTQVHTSLARLARLVWRACWAVLGFTLFLFAQALLCVVTGVAGQ